MRTLAAVVLCAWVLWLQSAGTGGQRWTAQDAYETRSECAEHAERGLQALARADGARRDGGVVLRGHGDRMVRFFLRCLPSETRPNPSDKD